MVCGHVCRLREIRPRRAYDTARPDTRGQVGVFDRRLKPIIPEPSGPLSVRHGDIDKRDRREIWIDVDNLEQRVARHVCEILSAVCENRQNLIWQNFDAPNKAPSDKSQRNPDIRSHGSAKRCVHAK